VPLTLTLERRLPMAEGDEERAERDERDEWWEKQKWKEEDERSERLHTDIEALLKKIENRHNGEDEDDDDGLGVRVPV
jgi:hypothetical protein